MSQTTAEREAFSNAWEPGDRAYKVLDGATYLARPLDADTAERFGCPGSDWVLIGNHGHIIGSMMQLGRGEVRIPGRGFAGRPGVLHAFLPWGDGTQESLRGHLTAW